ncbi:MAG: SDR family oxidoreductase [Pseudomonadales bacterium]|nr:SDR family oxidoreductase [Pseudomonadales bacterium]MBO6595490.1 SDR family oxidoreductase [Pseudomonadales bacterium]MBO6657102.1 SDR family oxidoreductase [Pseudomonadales bacterium]MBO6701990.1 SDR family oxidoreductase [Pseudomonadales bacterium]MBO6820951.1 SDR family oxidoreductase [Pseudomonadales bacterium]
MSSDLFDLTGEVAVVTGAGRGIGEGIAKVLAEYGASVVCAARRTNEIERVASEIVAANGKAVACTTDVTNRADLQKLADAAISEFGRLDMWVNNAGGSPVQQPLIELDREEWDNTLALNLTAVWEATTVASKSFTDKGRVLNISSIAAEDVIEGSGHYSAAKAGVNMMTRTFAKELGPRVRVNTIMPGFVPTEIMMTALEITEEQLPMIEQSLKLPAGRLGTPRDLGAAALYLLAPSSEWVTGQVIRISGGM